VALKAVGVNPFETMMRAGTYPNKPSLPFVPGNDAAGEVIQVGDGVSRFKRGDRVYSFSRASGSYAGQLLAKATQLQHLPSQVSFSQGAAMGVPYGTAHRALFGRGRAKAGERVLIHGASGGVGIAALQLARAAGLRVFGTAGSPQGEKALFENGAHEAFDHRDAVYFDKMLSATHGLGFDLIVEMLANVNLERDLGLLAPKGRVVVVGSRGRIELDPRLTMGKDSDIRGMSMWNLSELEALEIHEALYAGLENKSLRPHVGLELPLQEAPRAQEEVMKNGKVGKIVLLPEA
jgi:NADPH2:quinone reductase